MKKERTQKSLLFIIPMLLLLSSELYSAPPVTVYPSDVAPIAVVPGQTGVAMLRFYLLTPAGESATWDQIKITRFGQNSSDSDVSTVQIYRSVDTIFDGTDVQIGSGSFTAGSVTINIVDQNVSDTILYYYFVVYDIAAGANTNANIGAWLEADAFIFLPPAGSDGANLPFESTESDIVIGGSTMGTISVVKNDCDTMTVTFTFTGDENFNSTTLFEYNTTNTWPGTIACAIVSGASPRTCRVTGINLSTNSYYVRVTQTDPDGVAGTNPLVSAQIPSGCGTNFVPVVNILSPLVGLRIAGNATYPFKIQASVWESEDANPLPDASVQVSIDGGVWTNMTRNANYDDASNRYYVYEYNWAPASVGVHRIAVRASDSFGNTGYAQPNVYVYVNDVSPSVNTAGEVFKGEGTLLVRTNSAQVCNDCHALPSHGSASMNRTSYGSWQLNCRDCHSPHVEANIYLVNSAINTPNSGSRTVTFQSLTNFVDNAPPRDGICEVCHTKTNYYRNDGTQPQAHNKDTQNCTSCHPHNKGFAPSESGGGSSCCSCHSDLWSEMNSTNNYHHYMNNCDVTNLASSGTKYPADKQPGGTTDEDRRCLMCHVDHDIFRPDINPQATRSSNLRTSVGDQPDPTTDVGFVNADYGYTRGTATFTNGSATVTGSGTNWQSNMVGWYIKNDINGVWYKIQSVSNPTTLTLATNYVGTTAANVNYTIVNGFDTSTERTYISGLATFTNGSATVTGKGTKWLNNVKPGWRIWCMRDGTGTWYTVASVNSDTQLTLTGNYTGTTLTDSPYVTAASIYNTGTVSVTNGSSTVNGSGTAWANNIKPGFRFRVNNSGVWYIVSQVNSNTQLTLSTTYLGPTASGLAYLSYSAGSPTASFTNGSTAVTGNDTNWTASMNGWYIKNDSNGAWYQISSVNNAMSITLTSQYNGSTASNVTFTIVPPLISGICSSCHIWTQTKSYTQPDSTTQTPSIEYVDFSSSSHEYKVTSTFGTDSSSFYADCSKCHNDTLDPKSSFNAQTSIFKFGNHQSILRRILAPLGILSPTDPIEEEFCYQCHKGGTAGNDYYNVASMTAEARSMEKVFKDLIGTATSATANTLSDNTKSWTANMFQGWTITITGGTGAGQLRYISSNTATQITISTNWTTTPDNTSTYRVGNFHPVYFTSGAHKPIEGTTRGWLPDGSRHVECTDCHNPHAVARGIHNTTSLSAGSLAQAQDDVWGVIPIPATYNAGTATFTNGSATVTGNGTSWLTNLNPGWKIRNNSDTWERFYTIASVVSNTQLTLTENYIRYGTDPVSNVAYLATGVNYVRTESATRQHEVCLKCHSTYAWNVGSPPCNSMDANGVPPPGCSTGMANQLWTESDVAQDFNPNNYGYHPLFQRGRNQPPPNANTNWNSSAGRRFSSGGGLSNTFTDGWDTNSLVTCTDCHDMAGSIGPRGPHGSSYKWMLKEADPNVTVTLYDGTVTTPNSFVSGLSAGRKWNFCVNCHRADVYGYDSASTVPQWPVLSRFSHFGRFNNVCANNWDYITNSPVTNNTNYTKYPISCMNCHGGAEPGGIHGSTKGKGCSTCPGTPVGNAMGKRLSNGSSWRAHLLGDTSGSVSCYNLTAGNNVSTCTQHSGRTANPNYYYTWQ